jgi:RHS repeat-associated protein
VNIGGTAALYTYLGPLRIKKVAGPTTMRYIYAAAAPIAEYLGNSPVLNSEYIYAGPQLLATIASSVVTYHHPDHLSNRAETNSAGAVVRTYGHFPFGETWYETGPADKWKFTSYERDSLSGETGLDYASNRYYSSGLGAFLSADPSSSSVALSMPQSIGRYPYVSGDPVNFRDPSGLYRVCTLTSGGPGEIVSCVNIGPSGPSSGGQVCVDGQCFGDNFGPGSGGGTGGGIGGIIGGILGVLNGGGPLATVPGNCFLPGNCPSFGIPTIWQMLPTMPWDNPCIMSAIPDICGLTGFTKLDVPQLADANGNCAPGRICLKNVTPGNALGLPVDCQKTFAGPSRHVDTVLTVGCGDEKKQAACNKDLDTLRDVYGAHGGMPVDTNDAKQGIYQVLKACYGPSGGVCAESLCKLTPITTPPVKR